MELTWWFKIVHGVARIWRRRGLCMEEEERGKKKAEHMRKKKKTQGRDPNFIRVVILLGKGFVSVSSVEDRQAVRPAGRLLPFIGRQINRGPPGARRATINV